MEKFLEDRFPRWKFYFLLPPSIAAFLMCLAGPLMFGGHTLPRSLETICVLFFFASPVFSLYAIVAIVVFLEFKDWRRASLASLLLVPLLPASGVLFYFLVNGIQVAT